MHSHWVILSGRNPQALAYLSAAEPEPSHLVPDLSGVDDRVTVGLGLDLFDQSCGEQQEGDGCGSPGVGFGVPETPGQSERSVSRRATPPGATTV
jgi:hypothetical protein